MLQAKHEKYEKEFEQKNLIEVDENKKPIQFSKRDQNEKFNLGMALPL